MLQGLKHLIHIFIDEVYQVSQFHLYLLYLASMQFGIKIVAGGDVLQVPSPDENAVYDLRNNDFFNKILFSNNIHLQYNPLSCRFTDDLPNLLHELLETKQLPIYFKDKICNKNNLEFEVLTDENNKLAKSVKLVYELPQDLIDLYGKFGISLQQSQGNSNNELPISATYVIDTSGTIIYDFIEADYKLRADPKVIIEVL